MHTDRAKRNVNTRMIKHADVLYSTKKMFILFSSKLQLWTFLLDDMAGSKWLLEHINPS